MKRDQRASSPETNKRIGALIKKLRLEHSASQDNLAEAVGLERQIIYKIESGRRPLRFVEAMKICRVFGISPYDLRAGAEYVAPEPRVAHKKVNPLVGGDDE